MMDDDETLAAEPLLDLFGEPVTREQRRVRRSRRREAARFWAESKARGRIPPEGVLDYYMHAAMQAGDKEMAVRIAIALLPYRLPRLTAVMVAPPGVEAPRLRLAWGDEYDGDDPTAAGAIGAPAVFAALVPESDS
jgi:hypothetical protein